MIFFHLVNWKSQFMNISNWFCKAAAIFWQNIAILLYLIIAIWLVKITRVMSPLLRIATLTREEIVRFHAITHMLLETSIKANVDFILKSPLERDPIATRTNGQYRGMLNFSLLPHLLYFLDCGKTGFNLIKLRRFYRRLAQSI